MVLTVWITEYGFSSCTATMMPTLERTSPTSEHALGTNGLVNDCDIRLLLVFEFLGLDILVLSPG